MRSAWLWLGMAMLWPGPALGDIEERLFGLRWGLSADDAAEQADADVLHWSVHQLYGQSFELSRLPVAQDGALNRILYFDDQNQLLRIWVNFGHSDRSGWDENFRLTAARERYTALKTEHAGALGPGACDEPSIGGSVGALDEARFPPDKAVWSCAYQVEGTALRLSMRRLRDPEGERYDVILEAEETAAVAAYRLKHPLRGRGHGALTRAEELAEEAPEIDCEIAQGSDRGSMDTSPFALLYRRVCDFENDEVTEEELRKFDEVILLD